MRKGNLLKRIFYLFLIAMQILALGPAHKALSIVKNKDYTWKIYSIDDLEDLKAEIIQDPEFIRNWASMAHMLGFAWCGGTGSTDVGEDISFERVFENDDKGIAYEVYYLKGNYNSSDECSKKDGADKRLQMKISNVRLIIEPTTFKTGTPKVIDIKPVKITSAILENSSDKYSSTSISFNYTFNESWSRYDNFKLNDKIGIKTKFSVEIPISEHDKEKKLNVEFSEEQGWEQLEETNSYKTNSIKFNSIVPSKNKRRVELVGIEKNIEIPYEVKIYINYDITLTGFLRSSENGHIDHPTYRPTKSITFGGKNGLNAVEDLFDKYSNRHIKGYSEWDWKYIIDNFGKEDMDYYIKEICKVKHGREITGIFNVYKGTKAEIMTYNLESINTIGRDKSLSKENKVEVKDIEYFKTPGFNVENLTINK